MDRELTIGHDFEFSGSNSHYVPVRFRPDGSVPFEVNCDYGKSIQEIFNNTVNWFKDIRNYTTRVSGGAYISGTSLGGHVHLGGVKNIEEKDRVFLDNCLGWIIVAISLRQAFVARVNSRRYGLLCQEDGYHRERELKRYGFEYRTLPSPPSFEMMKAYFGLASFTGRVLLNKLDNMEVYNRIANFTPDVEIFYTGNKEELRKIASYIMKRIWKYMTSDEKDACAPIIRLLKNKQEWVEDQNLLEHQLLIPEVAKPFSIQDIEISTEFNDIYTRSIIADMIERGRSLTLSNSRILSIISNMRDRLIAYHGNKPIGFVGIREAWDINKADRAGISVDPTTKELAFLVVNEDYRDKGVASILMKKAVARFGAYPLIATTMESSTKVRRMLQQLNFSHLGDDYASSARPGDKVVTYYRA